jgi:ankyrin repeat protein
MSYEWNGHTETLLHKVASSGNPELAAALLKRGADAKTVCSIGYTTLHRAVPSGSSELVKLLLDAGADEMARTSDRRTALNIAQVCRSEEVFQFLASRPSTIVLRVQPR